MILLFETCRTPLWADHETEYFAKPILCSSSYIFGTQTPESLTFPLGGGGRELQAPYPPAPRPIMELI